jgi:hypothetical protein
MNDQLNSAIEVLAAKVTAKEEEANKLKKMVNELCSEAGLEPRYTNISDVSNGSALSIRRDQFYGQTVTSAARTYLEMRKAANLGAASVSEIYQAIKNGGYKFEAKEEETAKIGMRAALRKTSSIFHRLPTGDYGLLAWYPGAKAPKEEAAPETPERKSKAKRKVKEAAQSSKLESYVTNDEIRDVIFKLTGNFANADVQKAIKAAFPTKAVRGAAIPLALFNLKKKGFVRVVSPRNGATGAIYSKA